MKIHSYSEIFNLGHPAVADLTKNNVLVEEKVDGSQLSFQKVDGYVSFRSKGAELVQGAEEKMFLRGVEAINEISHLLHDEWVYRGEYLQKPKHNSLSYERVPVRHVIIYDIETSPYTFLSRDEKRLEAERLGLEIVPLLYRGLVESTEQLQALLSTESILGGAKIEGVVIKPAAYDIFGRDKKVLMGKHVSEDFKEVHGKEWKKSNPGVKDIIQTLIDQLKTEARWEKAVQHLREAGKIENDPRDIGMLMKEVPADVEKECREMILNSIWVWAWPQIRRGVNRGLPEWYKQRLLGKQFEKTDQ